MNDLRQTLVKSMKTIVSEEMAKSSKKAEESNKEMQVQLKNEIAVLKKEI
jgi:hypothetical protein